MENTQTRTVPGLPQNAAHSAELEVDHRLFIKARTIECDVCTYAACNSNKYTPTTNNKCMEYAFIALFCECP